MREANGRKTDHHHETSPSQNPKGVEPTGRRGELNDRPEQRDCFEPEESSVHAIKRALTIEMKVFP
jgi:hypothetical protein